jgi:hypothetical protein
LKISLENGEVIMRTSLVVILCALSFPADAQSILRIPSSVLLDQVQSKKDTRNVAENEAVNNGKLAPNAPSNASLNGSNGAAPTTRLRTSDIPPVALSKTLIGLSVGQRVAVSSSIQKEINLLTQQLNEKINQPERTQEQDLEINALNNALTAKRQALDFTLGNETEVTNAAAEAFAAKANPFFLMCGETLWARDDPLKWLDQIKPRQSALVKVGRSVGLLTIDGRPAGSSFVIGPSHVITNLHVLKQIAEQDEKSKRWKLRENVKVTFDVEYPIGEEAACPKANPQRSYYVNAVFAVPTNGNNDDLAVLLTAKDENYPSALQIDAKPAAKYAGNMIVAVIGYPGPPSDMTAAEQIQYFSTPLTLTPQFPFKRLSEGWTGDRVVSTDGFFIHRANTSGGNSGSPIIDLADGAVVGIHVQGRSRFNDVMGYNEGLIGERIVRLLKTAGLLNKN